MPTTRVLLVDPDHPDPRAIEEAAAVLRAGGLVAFATETVYGLGADATNPKAVARIFEAKGRPSTNPLIVHAHRKVDALRCVSNWPDRAEALAERFWPGPLTLVLPRSPIIPDLVTAGQETVGVRVPRPRSARLLIRRAGCPVAAPSANRSNRTSPTTAEHVWKSLAGQIDLILDSGPTSIGLESTVLDLTVAVPTVLRPGWITQEALAESLGEPVDRVGLQVGGAILRSPGQLSVHYAPRKMAFRVEREDFRALLPRGRYLVVTIGPPPQPWPPSLDEPFDHIRLPDLEVASNRLYLTFHHLDESPEFDALLLILPPDEPHWRAIRDRVFRATYPFPAD